MSMQIYKPNKSNSGFAFSFSMGDDKKSGEPVLYVNAIAQHSWDNQKRLGSFVENKENPEKTISVKFNEFECGSIISCLGRRYEYNTFHQFDGNKTTIKFAPWDKSGKVQKFDPSTKTYKESTQILPAFGITMTKNGNNTFKLPLEAGEVECLIVFVKTILKNIYKFRIERNKPPKRAATSDSDDCPI